MIDIDTAEPEVSQFWVPLFFPLKKPGVYITHNASLPLSDIKGGTLSVYMQRPLKPHKTLLSPNTVVFPMTCRHI